MSPAGGHSAASRLCASQRRGQLSPRARRRRACRPPGSQARSPTLRVRLSTNHGHFACPPSPCLTQPHSGRRYHWVAAYSCCPEGEMRASAPRPAAAAYDPGVSTARRRELKLHMNTGTPLAHAYWLTMQKVRGEEGHLWVLRYGFVVRPDFAPLAVSPRKAVVDRYSSNCQNEQASLNSGKVTAKQKRKAHHHVRRLRWMVTTSSAPREYRRGTPRPEIRTGSRHYSPIVQDYQVDCDYLL